MKTYTVPPKIEKHLRRNCKLWSKKGMIAFTTYALAFFLLGIIGKSCWDGYWRTHSWEVRSPVIFQAPVIIKELKPQAQRVISPVVEDKQPLKATVEANLVPTVEPFKKFMTTDANGVREKLLPLIAKDFPNVDDQVALDNILKKEAGYRADDDGYTCGMVQAQPCSKLPCALDYSDEAISCQYSWLKGYISNRYGTPTLAWQHHLEKNWY